MKMLHPWILMSIVVLTSTLTVPNDPKKTDDASNSINKRSEDIMYGNQQNLPVSLSDMSAFQGVPEEAPELPRALPLVTKNKQEKKSQSSPSDHLRDRFLGRYNDFKSPIIGNSNDGLNFQRMSKNLFHNNLMELTRGKRNSIRNGNVDLREIMTADSLFKPTSEDAIEQLDPYVLEKLQNKNLNALRDASNRLRGLFGEFVDETIPETNVEYDNDDLNDVIRSKQLLRPDTDVLRMIAQRWKAFPGRSLLSDDGDEGEETFDDYGDLRNFEDDFYNMRGLLSSKEQKPDDDDEDEEEDDDATDNEIPSFNKMNEPKIMIMRRRR